MSQNTPQKPIEVTAHDLPLHCPTKDAPLWARHPRVFLDVTHTAKRLPVLQRALRLQGRTAERAPLTVYPAARSRLNRHS
jgi:uncharacterized Zn-finger protein